MKNDIKKQIEELKEKLKEEKKKERLLKINSYRKNKYKQKIVYIPKEINKEKEDYYIFLKIAKKIGVETFTMNGKELTVDKEINSISSS